MALDQLSLCHGDADKIYLKLSEVAELAGVPSYVLRFWESEFPGIRPKRTETGQRLYRKSDVEIILTIKQLLHEKRFTIEGVKQHLRQSYLADEAGFISEDEIEEEIKDEVEFVPESRSEFITEIESHVYDHHTDNLPNTIALLKDVYLELQRIRELLS